LFFVLYLFFLKKKLIFPAPRQQSRGVGVCPRHVPTLVQYQFLSTPMPHTETSPKYCLMAGLVQPPNDLKSLNEGLLS
jgi:hypothetical protein